ncbi:hypothetical protein ACLOJK_004769 [Asimina triloba]
MSASSTTTSQSCVPPGFRFHPTEEELLQYYLRKKVALEKIDLDVIREIDVNKLEPWEIQEKCKIGSAPQNDWYFFSHNDRKYPTGTRTNRATASGFWKATGRDKVIHASCERIGMRKTLVFYKGRAPHGQKSDWIMHEYRLDDQVDANAQTGVSNSNVTGVKNIQNRQHYRPAPSSIGESGQEDGWVICRVFKKKNHHKTPDIPSDSPIQGDDQTQILGRSCSDGALEQVLQCTVKTCKQETMSNSNINPNTIISTFSNANNSKDMIFSHSGASQTTTGDGSLDHTFMQMPHLKSQLLDDHAFNSQKFDAKAADANALAPPQTNDQGNISNQRGTGTGLKDWAMVDRFAASQLNGKTESTSSQLIACFNDPNFAFCSIPFPDEHLPLASLPRPPSRSYSPYEKDSDLWPFQPSMQ